MITGIVTDAKTNETLPSASVYVSDSNGALTSQAKGVLTDLDGRYEINADSTDWLSVSYVGYQRQTFHPSSLAMNIQLVPTGYTLPVAEVIADKINKTKNVNLIIAGIAIIGIGVAIYFHQKQV